MGLFPEHRPLTGAEVGLVIAVVALVVLCCLGASALSLAT
jgi:hypothetical protein